MRKDTDNLPTIVLCLLVPYYFPKRLHRKYRLKVLVCFYLSSHCGFFSKQERFASFPYSMMTIFVMTLGELNYADVLMPWDKHEYSTLSNVLFIMFVLGMPIIIMNMLVRWTFLLKIANA